MADTPQYVQPPLDPSFMQAQQRSQQADVAAIQDRLKGDTASLLARFGQQPQVAAAAGAPTPPASMQDILAAGFVNGKIPLTSAGLMA